MMITGASDRQAPDQTASVCYSCNCELSWPRPSEHLSYCLQLRKIETPDGVVHNLRRVSPRAGA